MHAPEPSSTPRPRTAANRFGLDYRAEARRLGPPVVPIIDIHAHINGPVASTIYREAMDLFGVSTVVSQTRWEDAHAVREVMGGRIRFVAIPRYDKPPRSEAIGTGFLEEIRRWHAEFGARIIKLWAAPRLIDLMQGPDEADLVWLDSPPRRAAIELAQSLGMMVMVHVGDPDTWFATKYADAAKYRRKVDHYAGFERVLDDYTGPWMAAHMGGWPEDLAFLDGLLTRHPNLVLDTSATKWIVREVSKYPRDRIVSFLAKWAGRILFGSDIVTEEVHLTPKTGPTPGRIFADLASSPAEAFDLYASRYFALRTMWETPYQGESPIADPDLMMVDAGRFNEMSAPTLRGLSLPPAMLKVLYESAAKATVMAHLDARTRPKVGGAGGH